MLKKAVSKAAAMKAGRTVSTAQDTFSSLPAFEADRSSGLGDRVENELSRLFQHPARLGICL